MRPRKASNSFKEYMVIKKDAPHLATQQKRRSTLTQVLFGEKPGQREEKNQPGDDSSERRAAQSAASSPSNFVPEPFRNAFAQFKKDSLVEKKRRSLIGGEFFHQQHQKRADEAAAIMRTKLMHVVVMGPKRAGKTAFLRVLAENDKNDGPSTSARVKEEQQKQYSPTLEDNTYHIQLHDGPTRELILFHDTAGIPDFGNIEVKKAYMQVADIFLLFYPVNDLESFNRVDLLKKQLESRDKFAGSKEKREVQIIVIGTKVDLANRKVDPELALHWANRERVKLFETSTLDRDSIVDVVHHLSGKFFNREAKFSLSRRLKPEKSNSQIIMDF